MPGRLSSLPLMVSAVAAYTFNQNCGDGTPDQTWTTSVNVKFTHVLNNCRIKCKQAEEADGQYGGCCELNIQGGDDNCRYFKYDNYEVSSMDDDKTGIEVIAAVNDQPTPEPTPDASLSHTDFGWGSGWTKGYYVGNDITQEKKRFGKKDDRSQCGGTAASCCLDFCQSKRDAQGVYGGCYLNTDPTYAWCKWLPELLPSQVQRGHNNYQRNRHKMRIFSAPMNIDGMRMGAMDDDSDSYSGSGDINEENCFTPDDEPCVPGRRLLFGSPPCLC